MIGGLLKKKGDGEREMEFNLVSGSSDDEESDEHIIAYKGMRMRAIAIDVCIHVAICVALR